ncbi:MFS transporter [Luteococcus peritonei]
MALYTVDRFQAGDAMAGFAASSFVIGSLLARLFAGRLLDVVGRRKMLTASLVVFIVVAVAYIPTRSLWLLLLLRLVHGVAYGAGNTALTAAVQAIIPPLRRSEGTGYFGLSMTLAAAVGPLLGTVLGAQGHFTQIFWWCAASSVVAMAGALLVRLPEHPADAEQRRTWWRISPRTMIDPVTAPIGLVMLFSAIAYSGIITFLSSYARQFDVVGAASLFFIVYAAATLLSRMVLGRIQDTIGDNAVMYPVMLLFAASLLLLALWPTATSVVLAGALAGVGFGGIIPCAQTIAVHASEPRRIGLAIATFFLMFDAGSGLGPVLLGALVPWTGFRGIYLALAGLMVPTTVLYTVVHGVRTRRTDA